MRDEIRAEEEAIREGHRVAFDLMVERARLAPPQPHDPMRFRAVPPGGFVLCGMPYRINVFVFLPYVVLSPMLT